MNNEHVHSENCNHDHETHSHTEDEVVPAWVTAGTPVKQLRTAAELAELAEQRRVARNRRKASVQKARKLSSSKEGRRLASKGVGFDAQKTMRDNAGQTHQRTRRIIRDMRRKQAAAMRKINKMGNETPVVVTDNVTSES